MKKRSLNKTLKKLCEQPDLKGYPVIALSPSVDDQIKVSLGMMKNNGEYIEERKFVNSDYDKVIEYAKALALVNNSSHRLYEIRVFSDRTSECVRLF